MKSRIEQLLNEPLIDTELILTPRPVRRVSHVPGYHTLPDSIPSMAGCYVSTLVWENGIVCSADPDEPFIKDVHMVDYFPSSPTEFKAVVYNDGHRFIGYLGGMKHYNLFRAISDSRIHVLSVFTAKAEVKPRVFRIVECVNVEALRTSDYRKGRYILPLIRKNNDRNLSVKVTLSNGVLYAVQK